MLRVYRTSSQHQLHCLIHSPWWCCLHLLSSFSSHFCRSSLKQGDCILCFSIRLLSWALASTPALPPSHHGYFLRKFSRLCSSASCSCRGSGGLAVQHHTHPPAHVLHYLVYPVEGGHTASWNNVPQKAVSTQTLHPRYLTIITTLRKTVTSAGALLTPSASHMVYL